MNQQKQIEENLKKVNEARLQKQQTAVKRAEERDAASTEAVNQHNSNLVARIIKRSTEVLLEKRKCWRTSAVTARGNNRYVVTFNVWGGWASYKGDRREPIYPWQEVIDSAKSGIEERIGYNIKDILPNATSIAVSVDEGRNCLRGPTYPRDGVGELDRDCDIIMLCFTLGIPLIPRSLGWVLDKAMPRTRVTIAFSLK